MCHCHRCVSRQAGFSLPELLISMAVMLLIAGAATTALLKMTTSQALIWNRTQMHGGVRGATEVLQQEVGQAGRLAMSDAVTLNTNIVGNAGTAQWANVTPCAPAATGTDRALCNSIFVGENLVIDGGDARETVTVAAIDTVGARISAKFKNSHSSGALVQAMGAFWSGVVSTHVANGSDGYRLKLFGDINADGNMVYVEYYCDTVNHNLYRYMVPWNKAAKADPTAKDVLLSNIMPNPGTPPDCFIYQEQAVLLADGVTTAWFVTDVAITLTVVDTLDVDATTRINALTKQQQQSETKALLNVSPRNIINAWQIASFSNGMSARIQPMPPSITELIKPVVH